VPAETQIKIISSDLVASTPELARHAITRLRVLRLCDLFLHAMPESETEAKRIGAALDFDQDRHQTQRDRFTRGSSDDIAQTAQELVPPKIRKRNTKDVEIQLGKSPPPASGIA
jgi:hypothetical protein